MIMYYKTFVPGFTFSSKIDMVNGQVNDDRNNKTIIQNNTNLNMLTYPFFGSAISIEDAGE